MRPHYFPGKAGPSIMELRHLRYFRVLADTLNFTRAAEKLYITQSTLSHQIKQLEDEIGTPLFRREGKSISLTHAGQYLLEGANRAVEGIDDTIRGIRSLAQPLTGTLSIGSTHTFSVKALGQYLVPFVKEFPLVRLDLQELSAHDIEAGLLDERLDIGIAYTPASHEGLWSEPLFTEALVLVVSKLHALASRKRVRMVELHNQPLILLSKGYATRKMLDGHFRKARIEPLIVAEANTVGPILSLIRHHPVAAILSERAIPDEAGLHKIILQDPAPTRTAALLWKKNRHYPKIALEFARLVKENR